MKNAEIHRIIRLFENSFNGPAWHGPAVMEVLNEVAHDDLLKATGGAHNIAELVFHMTAWRNFLINKLKGDDDYDVNPGENFQQFDSISKEQWMDLIQKLKDSQDTLLKFLSKTDDEILNRKVAKRDYNFFVLIHGVIHHDLYHLGQINLLKKHV